MAIHAILYTYSPPWWLNIIIIPFVFIILKCVYRVYLHPLSPIPGPLAAKCTSLWLTYHGYIGDECSVIWQLHAQYGPVVRTGPWDVDIADGEALWPIYMNKGGFEKADYYKTFDIDGHATIFTSLSAAQRERRVKAVLPIFSMGSIKGAMDMTSETAEKFVARLQNAASTGRPVNLLNLTRAFALDAVTAYVFQKDYGSLDEDSKDGQDFSVGAYLNKIINDSRLYYLPSFLTLKAQEYLPYLYPNPKGEASETGVVNYIQDIVEGAGKDDGSYEGRLLSKGISLDETIAECKDALVAGTDSTGNTLAHLIWYLSCHPDKYVALKQEIDTSLPGTVDPLVLPYLTGAVKEALRLTMPVPIRLPRKVPAGGWSFADYHLPASTTVGVSAFQLHLNDGVFLDPHAFLPERWLKPTPEMNRDWLPFGKGARSCIARNLAQAQLALAVEKLVREDVLRGARAVHDRIDKYEWFLSRVKGDKIEVVWPRGGGGSNAEKRN